METPNHPRVGGFLLEIDISIKIFFTRAISWGLGDPSRTLSETILGPFWPQIARKNRFRRFSRPLGGRLGPEGFRDGFQSGPESRFQFFSGRLGIRERRELRLGSNVPTPIELQTPLVKWILGEIRISVPSQHMSELFSE